MGVGKDRVDAVSVWPQTASTTDSTSAACVVNNQQQQAQRVGSSNSTSSASYSQQPQQPQPQLGEISPNSAASLYPAATMYGQNYYQSFDYLQTNPHCQMPNRLSTSSASNAMAAMASVGLKFPVNAAECLAEYGKAAAAQQQAQQQVDATFWGKLTQDQSAYSRDPVQAWQSKFQMMY